MIELLGPTGNLIKGNLLDVARGPFERALRDLEPRLYVRWNPRKMRGWGCWEIRMKPLQKQVAKRFEYNGVTYSSIDYVESNTTSHVLDLAFLNYDAIRKLREMDTYNKDHWIHDLEYLEAKTAEEQRLKARKALTYALKQNRTAMRDLRQMIVSGYNPHIIAQKVGELMSQGGEK